MAVTLDYSLSPSFSRWATGVDLAAADETTLAYDCFCGGVTFVVEGADFSARWGWVTVLDFALSSTGSDEVKITASYTSDVVTVPATELHAASEAFLERVVAELCERYPALTANAFVSSIPLEIEAARP